MRTWLAAVATLTLLGCRRPQAGNIDLARWRAADREPGQWLALGRTFKGDRYSPLTQIDTGTVTRLGYAWGYDAKSRRGRVEHGQEATPIVVDGVLYVSGPWGSVFAVDAKTGAERWRYDPPVDGSYGRRACCDVVNRGLQVWEGRVYVGTLDGYLVSLDAATGREIWRQDTFVDRDTRFYTITSPPQVAKDVVVIGNSGGEFGVRGYITGYDRLSGEQRWRFFIVPGDPAKGGPEHPEMAMALETWGPNTNWESGLGGTVWGEMNYDPELNLLYVGTGNSTPYAGWHRDPSGGDNLFLVSILAINPDDGRLKWHYQQVPWEIWDYTATMNMILADIEYQGAPRKVLMQAPKNGFFYLLDRATGEVLSAKPYVYVNWATGVDSTGRPILTGKGNYQNRAAAVFPTQSGGHNWQPMAYSRQTGLVYIPAREEGMVMISDPRYRWRRGDLNMGSAAVFGDLPEEFTASQELPMEVPPELAAQFRAATEGEPSMATREFLLAWDPIEQRERWRVPLGKAWFSGGGVLTTAGGLVVQGTADGMLVIYHAATGQKLHQIEVGTGIMAAPVSYQIDGVQYLAVFAGFGGAVNPVLAAGIAATRYQNYGRILAFKLDGGPTPLPPARSPAPTPPAPSVDWYSDTAAARGGPLFAQHCGRCHGGKGEERLSAYPDLFRMAEGTHAVFDSIVLGGSLSANGMASFADLLSPADSRAIHSYLIREQRVLSAAAAGRAR
ncbi:MAG: PQQ-dependent dehydrogenase, methanol/ethanol family [Gemmatimonadetes bacterium]|nr:PQQ-dependent dehydrogenase, methanol/ethanol family [Gemmatimonadota bacterium]